MLSYRQQILLGYLAVLLVFMIVLFPLATRFATHLTTNAMGSRADALMATVTLAQDEAALIRRLKDQRPLLFFRASLINEELITLYDTHAIRSKRTAGRLAAINHPEVVEAFKTGVGQAIGFSDMLGQEFLYLAKRFEFRGQVYVLRMAVPYAYVASLTNDIEYTFVISGTLLMLAFSLLSWFIVSWLSRPVQEIIDAIRPYQLGLESDLPRIVLKGVRADDDFHRLATTVNELAERSRQHIARLQVERDEKASLLESLIEGVFAINPHLEIQDCNDAGLKMLGKKREEVMRQPVSSLGIPEVTQLAQRCIALQQVSTMTINVEGAGITFLDVVVAPTQTDQGAVIVLADTTIQHRILEMRKDFIANASHELKTPITIITGFAETLRDNPDLPISISNDIKDKIVRNCNRMNNLVKDLLALADIERLKTSSLRDVRVIELAEECRKQLATAYPTAEVDIKVEGPRKNMRVEGDASLLEMAIGNLLSNAAKYSQSPAQIRVSISEQGNFVIIQVADKGFGIPKADLPRIFERFYTVDRARSRKMGGTGLGLSIVETIVTKHFGTISVASELGVGTTFTMRLPKKQPIA